MDFIRIIIAIILPPLGVFLQVGFGGAFWLNILLTLLGYIPGIVHAVYIIAKRYALLAQHPAIEPPLGFQRMRKVLGLAQAMPFTAIKMPFGLDPVGL